jgi:hypothetical protein
MPLTLPTFSRHIDPPILERGRRYYADGHVAGLEELTPNRWQAEVAGTYPYTVTITIAADGALGWDCTCPYDLGPVCKHVVATLYALQAALDLAADPPRQKRQTRADKVRAALSPLSRDDLLALLIELANDDRQLAHRLLARYAAPAGDGKAAAKRLVADALTFGRDRYGLDYHGAADAARSVGRLLDRAAALRDAAQPAEAVLLYQAVLEEVVEALGDADDSSGALSDVAYGAMDELAATADELPPAGRAALFDYCVAHCAAEPFNAWDWGWDLAALGGTLITTPAQQAALFAAIDRLGAAAKDEHAWYAARQREHAAELKLAIIEAQDDPAAVAAFLQDNVHHDAIRLQLAHRSLQRGDLATARRLCTEWLAQPNEDRPGLRRDFLAVLLAVAERSGDTATQIRLTEDLFRDTGDMTAFRQLRGLVGPAAWPDYRPGLLARLRADPARRVDLGAVYAAERLWDDLLALVQQQPARLDAHHDHLAGRFPHELAALYERRAAAAIGTSPNRTNYQRACAALLRMRELDPAGAAAVVARWREEHKHRPAMQDELTKAFGPPAG